MENDALRGRSIALVGLMGAGKSTVGRALAARLGLPFVDSDAEVEKTEGLDVAELFERFGEAGFRDREREAIAALLDGSPRVIAAGGGAFVDEHIRRLMLEHCLVVWLDADVGTLARRVDGDRRRPLLGAGDPAARLAKLAAEREHAYAQAHIRVSTAAMSPEAVVAQIIQAVSNASAGIGQGGG